MYKNINNKYDARYDELLKMIEELENKQERITQTQKDRIDQLEQATLWKVKDIHELLHQRPTIAFLEDRITSI